MRRHLWIAGEPEPLPFFSTHRDWCRWLRRQGQLSTEHRACTETLRCVAYAVRDSGDAWRYAGRS
jgi:hypothetical protein